MTGKIYSQFFADMAPNADIQISAISAMKMFADSRYADIGKKCRYADIADADINIGTSLERISFKVVIKILLTNLKCP